MEFKNYIFTSPVDGLIIAYTISIPDTNEPVGIIQFVHGMAENRQRYFPMMSHFSSKGFVCVINDHRGHGESVRTKEDLGFMYSGGYLAMIEDAHEVTKIIRGRYPQLHIILFGHSMGAAVVRSYIKRYDSDIDGLIICGNPSQNPATGLALMIAGAIGRKNGDKYRSTFLQKLAFGNYNHGISHPESVNSWLCTDPEVVKAYDRNPECGFTFTINGFKNLLMLMKDSYSSKGWKMSHPELPILVVSGRNDPCLISEKDFFNVIRSLKKTGYRNTSFKLYPGMRHEIHNEFGKQSVFEDIMAFLNGVLSFTDNQHQ